MHNMCVIRTDSCKKAGNIGGKARSSRGRQQSSEPPPTAHTLSPPPLPPPLHTHVHIYAPAASAGSSTSCRPLMTSSLGLTSTHMLSPPEMSWPHDTSDPLLALTWTYLNETGVSRGRCAQPRHTSPSLHCLYSACGVCVRWCGGLQEANSSGERCGVGGEQAVVCWLYAQRIAASALSADTLRHSMPQHTTPHTHF